MLQIEAHCNAVHDCDTALMSVMLPWCCLWQSGKVPDCSAVGSGLWLHCSAVHGGRCLHRRHDSHNWHFLGAVVFLLQALQGCAWRPLIFDAAMTATSGEGPARLHCRVVMGSALQPAGQQPGTGLQLECSGCALPYSCLTHFAHHGQGCTEGSTEVVLWVCISAGPALCLGKTLACTAVSWSA